MNRTLAYYSWPISIVIFFFLLAAANIQLYLLSNAAHGGSQLIEQHAYESGLNYQQKLNAMERFRRAELELLVNTKHCDEKALEIQLRNKHGQPVEHASISAHVIYAASSKYDQQFTLTERSTEAGKYQADFDCRPGAYVMEFQLSDQAGEPMIFESHVTIPRNSSDL